MYQSVNGLQIHDKLALSAFIGLNRLPTCSLQNVEKLFIDSTVNTFSVRVHGARH